MGNVVKGWVLAVAMVSLSAGNSLWARSYNQEQWQAKEEFNKLLKETKKLSMDSIKIDADAGLKNKIDENVGKMLKLLDKFKDFLTKTEEEKKKDPPCEEVGRLVVILPELWKKGYVGYVTVNTGSVNDVLQMMALLKAVYESRQDLRGIAFQLRRVQAKISSPKPGSDERVRMPHWMVQLEVAPDWARLQLQMAERAAKMIEAPAPRVVEATGEIVEDVTDGEWLETGDDTAPDFGEEDATDSAPMAAEDKLPPAQGGPGWPAVPAQKAKFEAVCAKNGVVVNKERNDLKAIFGPAKIGTYALSTVIQTIEDWAASQAN